MRGSRAVRGTGRGRGGGQGDRARWKTAGGKKKGYVERGTTEKKNSLIVKMSL